MLRPAAPGQREQRPEFFKMAGGGNDFVIVDNRGGLVQRPEEFARAICTRRLSVGADGLILIETSPRATFRMRYYNSDGSAADFCANGTRCAARFAFMNVIAPRKMSIETDAGVIGAEIVENLVTLALPSPRDYVAQKPLRTGGMRIEGSYLLTGVPHYVVFIRENLWEQDIEPLGRAIRFHEDLRPAGANVNFVTVVDRDRIYVRTYERGVEGETLSCGSGVVSSVAVSALLGRVDSPVTVLTRSGIEFRVTFSAPNPKGAPLLQDIRFTGDARVIYRAQVTAETLEGFDPEFVRDPASSAKRLEGLVRTKTD